MALSRLRIDTKHSAIEENISLIVAAETVHFGGRTDAASRRAILVDENFPFAGMVRLSDNTFVFHALHQ